MGSRRLKAELNGAGAQHSEGNRKCKPHCGQPTGAGSSPTPLTATTPAKTTPTGRHITSPNRAARLPEGRPGRSGRGHTPARTHARRLTDAAVASIAQPLLHRLPQQRCATPLTHPCSAAMFPFLKSSLPTAQDTPRSAARLSQSALLQASGTGRHAHPPASSPTHRTSAGVRRSRCTSTTSYCLAPHLANEYQEHTTTKRSSTQVQPSGGSSSKHRK